MKYYKPSSLIGTWGAYVFLPVNIIIGTLIYADGASIEELIIASFSALFFMMILAYPTIIIASENHKNFAENICTYIKYKPIAKAIILFIPIINIGWYAIQTVMFVELIQEYYLEGELWFVFLIVICSFLFELGVMKYDYIWLKNMGLVGMALLLILVINNVRFDSVITFGYIRGWNVVKYSFQILGTWIFSSVTCIMDVTSNIDNGKKGFLYIVGITFFTDVILVFLGYVMKISISEFVLLGVVNLLSILVSIWTTNDSNFYSTLCSLTNIGIPRKYVFIFVPLISSVISLFLVKSYENFITNWLTFMSWVGVPLGVFWWIVLFKKRRVNHDNCIRRN